ncbi:hypothetical protein HK105_202059 [Polyrhizophydium stewartii]|uniref:ADP-ribosylation factor-like protein 2-binding protein n=1 Tax=Polyrhizophydium stewartii TaxID=2732419 RepID=A0ABR4NF60_9FUNG
MSMARSEPAPKVGLSADFGLSEEDISFESPAGSDDAKFDAVVGELEDIIMDDAFVDMQNAFLAKHHKIFLDAEENKLEYMDVFKKYASAKTTLIESYLSTRLSARLPWFSMPKFMAMIRERPDQADGDVFDILHSLGDFSEFKELVLNFKREQEGRAIDLSGLLAVRPAGSKAVGRN